jgi:hypothetical protein
VDNQLLDVAAPEALQDVSNRYDPAVERYLRLNRVPEA